MSKVALLAGGILLVALGAALRLCGVDQLLPYVIEPDPGIAVQVELLEGDARDRHSLFDWGTYPHLLARATVLLTDPAPPLALDAPIEEHFRASTDPVLRVRLVGALISILAVVGTILLARSLLPPGWALVAGAFTATSLLALHFGAQARPHAAAAGLVAVALAAAVRLPRRPGLAGYALVGVLVALAFGTLQSAVALLPPLLVAHLFATRGRPWRAHLLLLVPIAFLGLSALLLWPFLFETAEVGPAAGAKVQEGLLVQGGHKVMLDLFNGGGFPILAEALAGWEPALAAGVLLALGVGLFGLLRRPRMPRMPRPEALVMLGYALPYGLVIGLYQRSYERFLLPLLPVLVVFACWGLWRLAEEGRRGRTASVVLAAVLLLVSGGLAIQLVTVRARPSTPELAGEWLLARTGPDSPRVWLVRPLVVPALPDRAAEKDDLDDRPNIGRELGWLTYRARVLAERETSRLPLAYLPVGPRLAFLRMELPRDPDAYMRRLSGGERVLSEVYVGGRRMPELSVLTRELRRRFPIEARFEPGDGCEHPLLYQDPAPVKAPPMAWRLLRSRRLGPVLEVYDLRGPLR